MPAARRKRIGAPARGRGYRRRRPEVQPQHPGNRPHHSQRPRTQRQSAPVAAPTSRRGPQPAPVFPCEEPTSPLATHDGDHLMFGDASDDSTIDAQLEEEEQYADQLKEYLAFAESLRSVCRKFECLQYDLERIEDTLSSKSSQKEMIAQGKTGGTFSISGMKSKIFGSDTPEQRDQKVRQLEEQIQQAQAELESTNQEVQKFIEASLRDIDRFKRQKVKDLKEIFTNYAVMQIKQCKKGIAIWTSAKDCYTKM